MQELHSTPDEEVGSDGAEAPEEGESSGNRLLSRKIIAIAVAAALVLAGGTWLAVDLSQRRTVPDVTGTIPSEAEQALLDEDLTVDVTYGEDAYNLREENQTIAEQSPAAGDGARTGDEVVLVVAGRDAEVPDFAGLTQFEAKKLTDDGQFTLEDDFGDEIPGGSWKISGQSVEAGGVAPAGTAIILDYDIPTIKMPKLVGKTLTKAGTAIGNAGLNAKLEGKGDHVLSVDTPAGTVLEPFTKVTITLGLKMPDLIGKTPTEARELLGPDFTKLVFSEGARFAITGQSVPAGTIISGDTEISITAPGPTTTYRITGNGSAAVISWAAPGTFSIQQATGVSLPWEMTFPTDAGTAVFNAQLQDGDVITCQLIRNGKVVKELTSTGNYSVVQC